MLRGQQKKVMTPGQNRKGYLASALPTDRRSLVTITAERKTSGLLILLLEALLVAVLNGRIAVIEYLASRGAPLNSTLYGMTLLDLAVGNRMTAVAECLVRCGATPERESPA